MRARWRVPLAVAATLGLLVPWARSKAVSTLINAGGRRMNRGGWAAAKDERLARALQRRGSYGN